MTKLLSVKSDGSFITSFLREMYVIMVRSNSHSKSIEKPVLCIYGTSWLVINDPVLMFFGYIKVILIYLSYLATCIPLLPL